MTPLERPPTMFRADRYRDSDTGRERWAVLDTWARVWYFPRRYGQRPAQRLAARLNCKGFKP